MSSAVASAVRPPGKKLVIKTIKKAAELPEDFFAVTWGTLCNFVRAVHSMSHTDFSFEQLYGAVTNLVTTKHGASLYGCLRGETEQYVAAVLDKLASVSAQQEPASFLAALETAWTLYCSQIVIIRNVFLYLDTTFVRDTPGTSSIWDMGVSLFRTRLLDRAGLLSKILDAFLQQVAADRGGSMVDASVMSSVSRMFTTLRLYGSHLEPQFLAESVAFYTSEGVQKVSEYDIPQFLSHIMGRLREERERCTAYMDPSVTMRPLLAVLDAWLIDAHAAAILERGFVPLLDSHRLVDLKRLYALLGRVNRLDETRRHFADYTKRRAAEIVVFKDEEKDKAMVQLLLNFKDAIDEVVSSAFSSNEAFVAAVKSSMEFGINSRENKPAELVAKFMDAKMRGGARALSASAGAASGPGLGGPMGAAASSSSSSSAGNDGELTLGSAAPRASSSGASAEEELELILDKAMILFRCIHGKDVFEAFYKKDLAKRLLLGKSSSTDSEKLMVARLKAECGSQFTSKLEGMFKDMEGSAELMAQFEASPLRAAAAASPASSSSAAPAAIAAPTAATAAAATLDIHVQVLTSAYWPPYPAMPQLIIPPELLPSLTAFETFYASKFSKSRSLRWQHSLGHCLLRSIFPTGRKELDVSLFQTLVLLLFNSADSVPFTEIKARTGVEDGELRRTLQSLACGQVRVLRKEPKGRDVGDEDVFHFNAEFKAPLIRIKINTIQMKETQQEADATNEKVIQDRMYQVDATIVRIMKTRKTMTHQALLNELFSQLKFKAVPAELKKRIESLIERDYLERDEADPQLFRYLA